MGDLESGNRRLVPEADDARCPVGLLLRRGGRLLGRHLRRVRRQIRRRHHRRPARCAAHRPHRDVGSRVVIPNHKIKFNEGNPTGHGVLFIGANGGIYCYVPPGGV